MPIFRGRLLAKQQLLWQDPLSHHEYPEPWSGWAVPTDPSLGAAQAPMARRWFLIPWGCGTGGNPSPDHRDLQLCSGQALATGFCHLLWHSPTNQAWPGRR